MLRSVHRWPGLVLATLLLVLALSGAMLSVYPALERMGAPQAQSGLTVAELAARVGAAHPGLEQIRRAPSGRITAWWFDGGVPGSAVIDPASGADAGSADPMPGERWLVNLHRSLFLDDTGRLVMAAGAAGMLLLTVSGAALVARRMGGWRHWFGRTRGPWPGRVHVELARFAVGGLILSSLTALWMTASTFSLLPDEGTDPAPATATQGLARLDPAQIPLFAETPVSTLRSLSFPSAEDPSDVFTLTTTGGTALIDPGTGAVLSSAAPTAWERASEIVMMLHTGQGAAVLGLILGLMALTVPVLTVTGTVQWLRTRHSGMRLKGNAAAGAAETILLVASEGGTTWGFARTLRDALAAKGQSVHAAPLSQFDPARYGHAKRFLILAATYGEGESPAAARGVLARIHALKVPPEAPFAVLGFGDRTFPEFCAYAGDLTQAAQAIGWAELMPLGTVNRQSPQDFARWGQDLGAALGLDLELAHLPEVPAGETLRLIARRDYGAEVQAPAAILRFALPAQSLWQRLTGQGFARFEAGDLLGVLPAGSDLPRFYSLASGAHDGFVEICVRRQPGGLCSGQLTDLAIGDTITAFLRRNEGFHVAPARTPLILIGAGAGIAPLAGFIRANRRRPMHLWFGARTPESDYLYETELTGWAERGQLATLSPAFSRAGRREHVQDRLRREGGTVARLLGAGAQVMVCGGREMAEGVRAVLNDLLAARGQSLEALKAEGRYAEDIF
ncbi:MAG: PepSY domain-containing protein [Thioclava marina]|uniref:PepSY domain-containing protein n=1 Tax=Thioclava marina TaxID=1915077 RepID=UPI0019B741D5|nr:PepSY domain-containing protein [Thioclava marina]MBC7146987.1 PepSY domain-containing protein [Thioclava marina]